MRKITSVIFDMDGTLSDTQRLHASVEHKIISRYGVNITPEEISKKYAGISLKILFNDLLRDQPVPYDIKELINEKWSNMLFLADQSVEPVEGARELVKTLAYNNFRLGVASASVYQYVIKVLEKLGLFCYFKFHKAIITGDMVVKGKPDKEIFLKTALALNVEPKECLVVGDDISDMLGAKNAGMYCIGLVPSLENASDYPTKHLVTSLSQITLEYINKISEEEL